MKKRRKGTTAKKEKAPDLAPRDQKASSVRGGVYTAVFSGPQVGLVKSGNANDQAVTERDP